MSERFKEEGGESEIAVVTPAEGKHPVDGIIDMMFSAPDPEEALVFCNKIKTEDGRLGAIIVANERGVKAMMKALSKGGHPSLAESFRRSMASTTIKAKANPVPTPPLPKDVM